MGLIIAAVLMVGGVIGASVKEGNMKNDTTVRDTLAFERNATEEAYRHVQAIDKDKPMHVEEKEEVTSSK